MNFSPAGALTEHVYSYDAVGNRATHTETIGGTTTEYAYLYDALDRLTEVQDAASSTLIASYAYDPYGNRVQDSDGATPRHYQYDAAHQLETVRTGSTSGPLEQGFVYDANGNLTQHCQGGTVTRTSSNCTGATVLDLHYDALDRLTQADKTGLPSETYQYDDQGRRITKTVGSTTTDYLYMGPDIHAAYGSGWSAADALYTHGPRWDDPLIRATATTAEYYHQDGLGSVVALSGVTGTTLGTQRFDAWGNTLSQTGTIPQYGYTGREPDATGLIYYRARYYQPSVGRFTQRDPKGFIDGINRYTYALNNPINRTDPFGTTSRGSTWNNLVTQASSYYNAAGDWIGGLDGAEVAAGAAGVGIDALSLGLTVFDIVNTPVSPTPDAIFGAAALQAGKAGIKQSVKSGTRQAINGLKKGVDDLKGFFRPKVPKGVGPKAGSAGGEGAKKAFSNKVKDQARKESNDTCVFCGTKTTREPGPTRSEIDHSIPKSRGGNNTIENAQNTCRTCNRSKGAKTTDEFLNR